MEWGVPLPPLRQTFQKVSTPPAPTRNKLPDIKEQRQTYSAPPNLQPFEEDPLLRGHHSKLYQRRREIEAELRRELNVPEEPPSGFGIGSRRVPVSFSIPPPVPKPRNSKSQLPPIPKPSSEAPRPRWGLMEDLPNVKSERHADDTETEAPLEEPWWRIEQQELASKISPSSPQKDDPGHLRPQSWRNRPTSADSTEKVPELASGSSSPSKPARGYYPPAPPKEEPWRIKARELEEIAKEHKKRNEEMQRQREAARAEAEEAELAAKRAELEQQERHRKAMQEQTKEAQLREEQRFEELKREEVRRARKEQEELKQRRQEQEAWEQKVRQKIEAEAQAMKEKREQDCEKEEQELKQRRDEALRQQAAREERKRLQRLAEEHARAEAEHARRMSEASAKAKGVPSPGPPPAPTAAPEAPSFSRPSVPWPPPAGSASPCQGSQPPPASYGPRSRHTFAPGPPPAASRAPRGAFGEAKRAASYDVAVSHNGSGNAELQAAKSMAMRQLLALKQHPGMEARQKGFKELLRAWHPDKNPQSSEVATAVFQMLQAERGRVLSS